MRTTKAAKKLARDTKKASDATGDDSVHQGAEDKPLRLKIRVPPRQERKNSPEPEGNPQEADTITPPPAASPRQVRKALNVYLRERDRTPRSEPEEDDTPSETELLLREKTRTFADGVEDFSGSSDDDSKAAEDGEDEDEEENDSPSSESSSDEESVVVAKKPSAPSKKASVPPKKKKNSESVLSLKFSVPVGGANTTCIVPSTIPYKDLVTQLADTMSIAPKNVHVAYRFSLQNRSDSFNHLANEIHLTEHVSNARHTLEASKSKKEFLIEVKDLTVAAGKKGKGGEKGDKKKDRKKRRGESESEDESDEVASDGKAKSKPLSGPQWVAKLQKDNACAEHGGDGCLKYTTGHVPLSKPDLSAWTISLQNGYPSTTTPPPKLRIQAQTAQTGRKVAPTQLVAPAAPSVPWPPYHTPAPHPRARYNNIPSSDPIEEAEDVTLFPRLKNYLQELNDGPRGQGGHEFAQFLPEFEHEKYIRIVDLEGGMTVKDVKDLVPNMAQGTASKLLGYVTSDIKVIRKKDAKERKRARKHSRFT
ncbi:hypothetical protein C8F04DRAFT_1391666 [Mycena alexandri]|uniref:Uncharacterized protein n=1 Tax=Mycena alexandri TaxID=1745969 RepID=A0AAD6XCQ9_9AGAR|nr:hypothetical protein C8F04DRAFT_1391666 [Mycena alexandri]